MGRACSTNEACVQFLFPHNLKERHLSEDLDVYRRTMLNPSLKGSVWDCRLESCDSG
jgi:hypothetical protein